MRFLNMRWPWAWWLLLSNDNKVITLRYVNEKSCTVEHIWFYGQPDPGPSRDSQLLVSSSNHFCSVHTQNKDSNRVATICGNDAVVRFFWRVVVKEAVIVEKAVLVREDPFLGNNQSRHLESGLRGYLERISISIG